MKKWIIGSLTALATIFVGIFLLFVIIGGALKGGNDCDPSDSSTEVIGGSTGDWIKEGTLAHNRAKATYEFWIGKGLSGAAASGIVGWINSEGGFVVPDRAEGHVGSNDEKRVGVSEGVVPKPIGGYKVGGAGVYQFTPYTKFAPLGDKKWLDLPAQSSFVFDEITKKKSWYTKYDLTGGHHSFKQFAKSSSPTDATLMWNAYERGNESYIRPSEKKRDALQAYKMFGGENVSANDSLLGNATDTGKVSEVNDGDSDDQCSAGDDSSEMDGTGVVPKDAKGKVFAANEIPADLKKFLLPINLSDARGVKGEKWVHPGDQCVDYSVSEAVQLWNKTKSWSQGNGIDQAKAAISLGYAVKDSKPHKGDLVSSDGTNQYGHTWIVGHVFEDGSVLVQEENYSGKSGESNGTPNTWDVGILPPYKNQDSWKKTQLWGKEMGHPQFAKPKYGMKK